MKTLRTIIAQPFIILGAIFWTLGSVIKNGLDKTEEQIAKMTKDVE